MVHEREQKAATPDIIAAMYGIPMGTLANLRWLKRGPKYFKRGRRIFYFIADFEKWLKEEPAETMDSMRLSKEQ
jgi:hypothetical protein